MNTGIDYKVKTNEELVALYVEKADTKAFETLMKNTEALRVSLANKFVIPGNDFDDLVQEGVMEVLNKIKYYKSEKSSFTSFLYFIISNKYKNMYNYATCGKRNLLDLESMEQIESFTGDEGSNSNRGSRYFSVECEEYERIELLNLIDNLNLSAKERIVARFLAHGWDKADIGREIGMSNSAVCVLSKRIGKKMILAGAVV